MNTSPRSPGCLSSDDLSAAADGAVPEELAVHLQGCAACQRDLATLQRIDRVLRAQLAPPPGLSERIRQRVSEATAAEPVASRHWWLSPVLRLAAAVVISAAAVAIMARLLTGGTAPGDNLVVEKGAVAGAPAPLFETVSSGPNGSRQEGSGSDQVPQDLPRLVRHVWTVGNAAGERDRLQALLPKGSYEVSTVDGNTVFTVQMTDRGLQALVDRLADDSKWQLASPELPQPRKPGRVALTGRDVRYSLVLVESGAVAR